MVSGLQEGPWHNYQAENVVWFLKGYSNRGSVFTRISLSGPWKLKKIYASAMEPIHAQQWWSGGTSYPEHQHVQ